MLCLDSSSLHHVGKLSPENLGKKIGSVEETIFFKNSVSLIIFHGVGRLLNNVVVMWTFG